MNKKWMVTLLAAACLGGLSAAVAEAGPITYSTDGGRTWHVYRPAPPPPPGVITYSVDGGPVKVYKPKPRPRPAPPAPFVVDGKGRTNVDFYQCGGESVCAPAGTAGPAGGRYIGPGTISRGSINPDRTVRDPYRGPRR